MTDADPQVLADPGSGFHAVLAGEGIVGFCSFGVDGRVPGWDDDDTALDAGAGLRPDLVGRGLGREVVAAGLAHGRVLHRPTAFRVTVASANTRALRTVASLGFERVARFEAARSFEVLVRSER